MHEYEASRIKRYTVSTDIRKMDIGLIHYFLTNDSYWAKGISREKLERYMAHSLNFGLFENEKQIGYARVISDFTTIAYLGDVFILPEYRGNGLSKLLLHYIHSHPDLQALRRWILLTADAHGLYQQFGWTAINEPAKWMERRGGS